MPTATPTNFDRDHYYPIDRVRAAYESLVKIAAVLRDTATSEIWTAAPEDNQVASGMTAYSLAGWRMHFRNERVIVAAFDTAQDANVNYRDDVKVAVDGYLVTIANLATSFNQLMDLHKNGSGDVILRKITTPQRNALASAIEAELQA